MLGEHHPKEFNASRGSESYKLRHHPVFAGRVKCIISYCVMAWTYIDGWLLLVAFAAIGVVFLYLLRINHLLKGTPEEIRKLAGPRWTEEQLRKTYEKLDKGNVDYTDQLPPKLDRRYIVTGGNGMWKLSMLESATHFGFRSCWWISRFATARSRSGAGDYSYT